MNPFSTATEAAAGVRSGRITSRELTERLLGRVDAINPALRAHDRGRYQRRRAACDERG
jgi:Asp-tRNA(Asn)/Glu-tRNA(Gln) amidotransferase A subunit family amidase